jgi:uncharacterized membrane protein YjgN (DUF898 family)
MDGQERAGRSSFFRKPAPPGARVAPPPLVPPEGPPPPSPVPPAPPSPPRPPVHPPSPPQGPASPGPTTLRRPTFHGAGETLFGIHVVNILLTLITLGIYYFWAKTKVRRYLSSQTEIEGDRFAYHGTARELLLGTLKAVVVFGLPILLLNLIRDVLDVPALLKAAAGVISGVLVFLFFPVAIVGARRYRLSRTSWRGIRFSFRGEVRELIKIFILGSVLTGVTLGFYYPFFLVSRQAFMVSHSYFGSERFAFSGRGRDLFRAWVVAALLTLPTLGLCWFWYVAFERRYFWDHTQLGTARFSCGVTGGALLGLWAVNVLLLVGTLGLAWPWVRVRNIRFTFRYLALVGSLDLARIQQEAQQVGTIGEGLSSFFDSGFDLA